MPIHIDGSTVTLIGRHSGSNISNTLCAHCSIKETSRGCGWTGLTTFGDFPSLYLEEGKATIQSTIRVKRLKSCRIRDE